MAQPLGSMPDGAAYAGKFCRSVTRTMVAAEHPAQAAVGAAMLGTNCGCRCTMSVNVPVSHGTHWLPTACGFWLTHIIGFA